MIKIKDGIATREPFPAYLPYPTADNYPEAIAALADLFWVDPSLGDTDCAWWPEQSADEPLVPNMKYGAEVLTLDTERKVVLVSHEQVPLSAEELAARNAAITAQWAAQIAARRFAAETAGTTIDGMPIDTSRDSQGLITGAAVQAMIDSGYSLHWKTSAGFVELTGQQILGVASAVRAHVQACFNREAALLGAVADGSITATMIDEGWPT